MVAALIVLHSKARVCLKLYIATPLHISFRPFQVIRVNSKTLVRDIQDT